MGLVLGKIAFLIAAYVLGIVVGVILHELGHALVALLATRQRVAVEIGTGGREVKLRVWRLDCVLRGKGLRYGATRYVRNRESTGRQIAVALGGPLASLASVVGFGWLVTRSLVGNWEWIGWLGLCVASFRIFIVSVWPIRYRSSEDPGAEWESDGLDIWQMWKKR